MSDRLNIINEEDAVKESQKSQPWYAQGLRFECTQCGQCCTGSPGYVWVTEEEVTAIAEHLKLSIPEFSRRYLRSINNKLALLERPHTFDCVFLQNNRCSVYTVRPKQCRTFPWWVRNLKSKADWQQAASYCEGINAEGAPLVPLETIQQQLKG